MKYFCTIALFYILSLSCSKNKNTQADINQNFMPGKVNYLALGDSYTIGEAVSQNQSFPFQLQQLLKDKQIDVATPTVVARTGWTTDELQEAINSARLNKNYQFVTLLIGVNNQYRNYPIDTYRKDFTALLQQAIAFAGGDKSKVFVISIPDWGVTPFGKSATKSPETIAKEIDAFNAANQEITLNAGVSYTNITPASRNAATDTTLIAGDGLHPSAKMYAQWADALLPKILNALK